MDLHETMIETFLGGTEEQSLCDEINEHVGKTLEYMVIKRLVPKSKISTCSIWERYLVQTTDNLDSLFILFDLSVELEVYQDHGDLSKRENLHFLLSGHARYTHYNHGIKLQDLRLDTAHFMNDLLGWEVESYPKDVP
jgi:hypothetical protein